MTNNDLARAELNNTILKQNTPLSESPPPAMPDTKTDATPTDPVPVASTAVPEPEKSKPESTSTTPEKPINLNLNVIDFAGKPISGLKYQFVVNDVIIQGTTDSQGCSETICLKPNHPLELFFQKDDGSLASKYKCYTGLTDMSICAVSPHIKAKVVTETHRGAPAPKKPKTKPAKVHAPVAPGAGQIKGDGKHANVAKQQKTRNTKGNPRIVAKEKSTDWAKRNQIPTLSLWSWFDFSKGAKGSTKPVITPKTKSRSTQQQTSPTTDKVSSPDQKPPKEVTELVKIMEEQAGWQWKKMFNEQKLTSATIKTRLISGTFTPLTGKPKKEFNGRCYASVKVGLLRANYVKGVDGGVSACGAGPWLRQQGFRDVTKTLPDGRWAFPGDVIVYRNSDYAREKLHKTDGHIDVRTYDGYISDAKTTRLPDSTKYIITGIYRKTSDPLPDLRVKAFLKVIREWECHEEQDDAKRYFLLYQAINGKRRFTDTSKHPYEGLGIFDKTPAGAYQITFETYKDLTSPRYGIGTGFSPFQQDRMAVALLQQRGGNALGLIRKGEITEAAYALNGTWSSLPGGRHQRREKKGVNVHVYSISDLLERFRLFLNELIGATNASQ